MQSQLKVLLWDFTNATEFKFILHYGVKLDRVV